MQQVTMTEEVQMAIAAELKRRFPWLGTDEMDNVCGDAVVDALNLFYGEMAAQPRPQSINSLLSMEVIASTDEAVYLRLPREMREPCGCSCEFCKAHPTESWWDTLVVATKPKMRGHGRDRWSWRCHMPEPWKFQQYMDAKKRKAATDGK
jgi:hypothetical protein